ncbi:hypothetical protein [Streptomyces eurythermus]
MFWWSRVRVLPAFAVCVAICQLSVWWARDAIVPLPSLLGGVTIDVPARLLLPMVPAVCWLLGEERVTDTGEATASRPVHAWQVSVMSVAGVTASVIALGHWAAYADPVFLAVARNMIGYLGFGVLLACYAGPRNASLAVILLPLVCSLAGAGGPSPMWWAWPLAAPGSWPAGVLVAGLFLVAQVAVLRRR